MDTHPVRVFKLSPPGKRRGVSCDADGAFIDDVPLLKRTIVSGKEKWTPRDFDELSAALSKHYALPIDISSKVAGISAVARALNEGAVARAQLAALFLRFPGAAVAREDRAVSKRMDRIYPSIGGRQFHQSQMGRSLSPLQTARAAVMRHGVLLPVGNWRQRRATT